MDTITLGNDVDRRREMCFEALDGLLVARSNATAPAAELSVPVGATVASAFTLGGSVWKMRWPSGPKQCRSNAQRLSSLNFEAADASM